MRLSRDQVLACRSPGPASTRPLSTRTASGKMIRLSSMPGKVCGSNKSLPSHDGSRARHFSALVSIGRQDYGPIRKLWTAVANLSLWSKSRIFPLPHFRSPHISLEFLDGACSPQLSPSGHRALRSSTPLQVLSHLRASWELGRTLPLATPLSDQCVSSLFAALRVIPYRFLAHTHGPRLSLCGQHAPKSSTALQVSPYLPVLHASLVHMPLALTFSLVTRPMIP